MMIHSPEELPVGAVAFQDLLRQIHWEDADYRARVADLNKLGILPAGLIILQPPNAERKLFFSQAAAAAIREVARGEKQASTKSHKRPENPEEKRDRLMREALLEREAREIKGQPAAQPAIRTQRTEKPQREPEPEPEQAPVPEGYKSANEIAVDLFKELRAKGAAVKMDAATLKANINTEARKHTGRNPDWVIRRKEPNSKALFLYFHPELVERVKEELEIFISEPENFITVDRLAEKLRKSPTAIMAVAEQFARLNEIQKDRFSSGFGSSFVFPYTFLHKALARRIEEFYKS